MKTWQGIFTGNFAVNADWKELIAGMKRSRREWWKVHENFKILWDSTVQCDRKIEARKPDIVFIDKKERVVIITDLAIPGDDRVKGKELEKLEKYQLLKDEIAKVWRMRKVIVVPVVIRALGAVSVNFKEYMKRIGVNVWLEVIQKTTLLWTAKILRKVLSLYQQRKERLAPVVTSCNPLPRTINQAEHPA